MASERNLEALRRAGGPYLVGTPRVASPDGSENTFILCRSTDRKEKEAAIHDRFEHRIEERLAGLQAAGEAGRLRSRGVLQQWLGRLKLECSRVARAYSFHVEGDGETLRFSWSKDEAKARFLRHTEGAYLLRTNLDDHDEPELWNMYMQLNDAEAAFRTLRQDRSIRPVFHQTEHRVKAHVLVCFVAYAMHRTLDRLAETRHLGSTARRVLDSPTGIESGDVILPLVDGRELTTSQPPRCPPAEILTRLGLELPERIGTDTVQMPGVVQTRL